MKLLCLVVKKKWFDMISSGEKPEEYREIKPYWISRLIDMKDPEGDNRNTPENIIFDFNNGHDWDSILKAYRLKFKQFDAILFKNGYSINAPEKIYVFNGFFVGKGREEWGAEPGKKYFVIKLGERIQ